MLGMLYVHVHTYTKLLGFTNTPFLSIGSTFSRSVIESEVMAVAARKNVEQKIEPINLFQIRDALKVGGVLFVWVGV